MPISRQEVDSILNVQREVLQTSREVKVLVQHAQTGQQQQQPAPVAHGSQDAANQQMSVLQQILGEIRENMNVVRREFGGITTRLSGVGGGGGPQAQVSPNAQCASCVSTTALAVLLGLHLLTIVGFMVYQSNKADKQKKFY